MKYDDVVEYECVEDTLQMAQLLRKPRASQSDAQRQGILQQLPLAPKSNVTTTRCHWCQTRTSSERKADFMNMKMKFASSVLMDIQCLAKLVARSTSRLRARRQVSSRCQKVARQ